MSYHFVEAGCSLPFNRLCVSLLKLKNCFRTDWVKIYWVFYNLIQPILFNVGGLWPSSFPSQLPIPSNSTLSNQRNYFRYWAENNFSKNIFIFRFIQSDRCAPEDLERTLRQHSVVLSSLGILCPLRSMLVLSSGTGLCTLPHPLAKYPGRTGIKMHLVISPHPDCK